MNKVSVLTGWSVYFLFCLLIVLGFYLVGGGVTLSRRRRHTRFAYVSIPIDDPLLSRGEHCSPVKINFSFIVLFTDEKYQKSARRTRALLLTNLWRRARVSRANRAWQVRAANGKVKVGDFAALRNLILPRVRTYHTKKPSRFVHALLARPL